MGSVQNGLHGYGQHGHGQHPQQGRQICADSLPDAVVTFFNSNIESTSFRLIEPRSTCGAGSFHRAAASAHGQRPLHRGGAGTALREPSMTAQSRFPRHAKGSGTGRSYRAA
jgi:hypothetical protein